MKTQIKLISMEQRDPKRILILRHCSLRTMPDDRRYNEAMTRIEIAYIQMTGKKIQDDPEYKETLEIFETNKIY